MAGLIIVWLICGFIAAAIGGRKGEGVSGFFWGLLLGPFGILIVLFSRGNKRSCPFCQEQIYNKAIVCPHCKKDTPTIPNSNRLTAGQIVVVIILGLILSFFMVDYQNKLQSKEDAKTALPAPAKAPK
jgi:thiol-disulfide isomerase/thioredoxin